MLGTSILRFFFYVNAFLKGTCGYSKAIKDKRLYKSCSQNLYLSLKTLKLFQTKLL